MQARTQCEAAWSHRLTYYMVVRFPEQVARGQLTQTNPGVHAELSPMTRVTSLAANE